MQYIAVQYCESFIKTSDVSQGNIIVTSCIVMHRIYIEKYTFKT